MQGKSVEITRLDRTAGELRKLASSTGDGDVVRRLLAIALVLDGADRQSAAQACGMDRQTLRDWVHRYNDEGVEGLVSRKSPGVPARLRQDQKQRLAELVEAGPDIETDGVVRWRRADLARKIREEFGVDYHERTVGKLLASLGYVRLSVRPQHPKSEPEVQEAYKKTSPQPCATVFRNTRTASRSKSGSRMKHGSASREA